MNGKTTHDVALDLAKAHRKADKKTMAVFVSDDDREVRLVEVSGSVASHGEVLPFRFAPRPKDGIPFPSVLIVLSPAEWEMVQSGQLNLPEGWALPTRIDN